MTFRSKRKLINEVQIIEGRKNKESIPKDTPHYVFMVMVMETRLDDKVVLKNLLSKQ